jgi:hypothetical protein
VLRRFCAALFAPEPPELRFPGQLLTAAEAKELEGTERAVLLRMNGGIAFQIGVTYQVMTQAFTDALDWGLLWTVVNPAGKVWVLNPRQMVYFEGR